MFDITAGKVERTQDDDYLVSWRGFQPGQRIAIYMSDTADHYYAGGDLGTPLLYTTEQEVLIRTPDQRVRFG